MKKTTLSLYQTLFVIGLMSIVVSMVTAYILVSGQLNQFFVDASVSRNREISNSIANYINNQLADAVVRLEMIDEAIDPDRMTPASVNDMIQAMNEVGDTFIDIEVVDVQGHVIYTLPTHANEIGFDRSREAYYDHFRITNAVYWSSVQLSPYTNSNTIAIGVKSRIGYIIGYLDLSEIQALSSVFINQFGSNKVITITDKFGIFLVNEDVSMVEERRQDPHHAMAVQFLAGESLYLHQEEFGEQHIVTFSRIESTEWIISIAEPYSSATAGISTMINLLLAFAGLMLSGYAILLWRGNRRVVHDIQSFTDRLSSTSQTVETTEIKGYFKEFKSLHESFNRMIGKIADRDKQLTDLAFHDALTGFYNRSYLDHIVVERIGDEHQPYAVAYIDLDNFSHVNDSYGHHVGDQMLVAFSQALGSVVNRETEVIRLGGDEFILIIRSEHDIVQHTKQMITEIMSISNEPIRVNDRSIYFTMSTGISFYPTDGQDFWTLLRNADMAMYAAKAEGKNKVKCFTSEMNKSVEDRLTIEQYLRPALKKSEFRLEYQPQVSVDGTTIRGFEALIRWDNPILGLISPMEFIRAAEENRSIIPIGQWVMRTACTKIKGLNLEYGTSWVMAVNVSPVELKEPNFAASVHHIIQETDIRPEWLEIEITENIAVDEFSQLRETLEELHRLGVKLSIDDFGTGYSSLSYIQNIPLDVLKVDRTFITHLGEPTGQNLMTETIFLMTKKLGLLTIAEGVETPSQLAWLKAMGCDYVQGYLISRPLPCEPLRQFIREKLGR